MVAKSSASVFHGVGRRKSSVSRVWLKPGNGKILVNGKEYANYFTTESSRRSVEKPFKVLGFDKKYNVQVNVFGGGVTGQADATRLGISRALLASDEKLRADLRKNGLLTVDARVVERKKYGQRGARRSFQFVKR